MAKRVTAYNNAYRLIITKVFKRRKEGGKGRRGALIAGAVDWDRAQRVLLKNVLFNKQIAEDA